MFLQSTTSTTATFQRLFGDQSMSVAVAATAAALVHRHFRRSVVATTTAATAFLSTTRTTTTSTTATTTSPSLIVPGSDPLQLFQQECIARKLCDEQGNRLPNVDWRIVIASSANEPGELPRVCSLFVGLIGKKEGKRRLFDCVIVL